MEPVDKEVRATVFGQEKLSALPKLRGRAKREGKIRVSTRIGKIQGRPLSKSSKSFFPFESPKTAFNMFGYIFELNFFIILELMIMSFSNEL